MTTGVFENAPATESVDDVAQLKAQVELLTKRITDKDTFINQLETETAEMRAAIEKTKTVEELLAEVRKQPAPTPVSPPVAKPATVEEPNEDDLVARVEKALEAKTHKQRQDANAKAVEAHLVGAFGSEEAAAKAVAERAAALGVGVQFLLETAKQSPDAFYELVKVEGPKQNRAPQSEINTAALKQHAPGAPKEGTDAYYRNLRKEVGDAAYFSPKIQNQRMKDALRLGEAFFQ